MVKTDLQHALSACRSTALVLLVFGLAINLLMLASPLYMMHVFDHVLSSGSLDTLIMLTLITAAALGALGILDGLRGQLLSRTSLWLEDRAGPAILADAMRAALRGDPAGGAQALRDLGSVKGFLTGPAVAPLMDAPWAPVFVAALFLLHPLLGIIGAVSAALLFGLALLNEAATRHPLAEANVALARTHSRAEAALRNAEAVQAMGMMDGVVRLWRQGGAEARQAQLSAGARGAVMLSLSRYLRLLVQTLILGVGAWLVIEHRTSAGAMFAATFLLGRALAPVENSIAAWRSFTSARLAYCRLVALAWKAPRPAGGMKLPRPGGELSVERVTFAPPGTDQPTLRAVSFALRPGELLGIVGPSAAGKSTLARLVAGAWNPGAGAVRLDGAEIAVWLASGGARHIGYLPQDIELFAGTVKDNIARLGEAEPEEVIEAAKLVGLHDTIMRLPRGYDSEIGDAGLRLSGGQRQRVALARAVFGRPRLLVLDEPNSSLDPEGEEALGRAIQRLKADGTTIVVVAHRPSVLAHADKLLVLRAGAVEAFGDRDAVIARLNGTKAPRTPQTALDRLRPAALPQEAAAS